MIGAQFLARLPAALNAAMLDVAQSIAHRARAGAPRRSGKLADSISVQQDGEAMLVVSAAPHAAALELGTANRAPQPFLRPALLEERSNLRARIYQAIREAGHG